MKIMRCENYEVGFMDFAQVNVMGNRYDMEQVSRW